MKKVLIAVGALALVAGIIVYGMVSKNNAANKKQLLKIEYANLCSKYLQADFADAKLTDDEQREITRCVVKKEEDNINNNKTDNDVSTNLKMQIVACIKELKINTIAK
jgi:FtsZ-interacting cell division protein ZipA